MPTPSNPSPYETPELYDLVLEHFRDDLAFWLAEAKAGSGPVLEIACGTGRVLLHLLANGVDADGLDSCPAMLERLRTKAAARGLTPKLSEADMRDFTLPRRYRRVFLALNGFAHCEEIDDQLRCLRCCREHLEPGGALVIHMSYPSQKYWLGADDVRVLEMEVPREGGGTVEMWDTRTKHRVTQRQHSLTEIEEIDDAGTVVRKHAVEVDQRWFYRFELELLLRTAGFSRWEIQGDFEHGPLERDEQQMIAYGWRD